MDRFRPNIEVAAPPGGALAPWEEDSWLSMRVGAGGAELRGVKRCARCQVTTTDQASGRRGGGEAMRREPLATLLSFRRGGAGSGDVFFAVNCVVAGLARLAAAPRDARVVRVGDEVRVLERGAMGPA